MRFLLMLFAVTALAEQPPTRILVAYHFIAGETEPVAQAVQTGAASATGVEVTLRRFDEVTDDDIASADGIVVGTPVQYFNFSVETKAFLDRVPAALAAAHIDPYTDARVAGVFCTGYDRAGGKDIARLSVLNQFIGMGYLALGTASNTLGVEATTATGPPGNLALSDARNFARRFANFTRQIRLAAAAPPLPDQPPTRVLVAYHSLTGNTEMMAQAVRDGAASVKGVEVDLRKIEDVTDEEILAATGVVVGTPVHWLNLSAEAKQFLERMGALLYMGDQPINTNFRTGGAFCTGGDADSGKDMARLSILNAFLSLRYLPVGGPPPSYLGAEATGGKVNEQSLKDARSFGERFARVTRQIQPPPPATAAARESSRKPSK